MREQKQREKPYTQGEVCAMMEGAIAATLVIGLKYNIPGFVTLIEDVTTEMTKTFQKVAHEHIIRLDKDSCYGCDMPMVPDSQEVGGYVH
jgi:hypothetical protein